MSAAVPFIKCHLHAPLCAQEFMLLDRLVKPMFRKLSFKSAFHRQPGQPLSRRELQKIVAEMVG